MKTRPPAMAGEDFTGAWVLKVQASASFAGNVTGATPSNAGPPRNIGQVIASAEPGSGGVAIAAPERKIRSSDDKPRTLPVPRAHSLLPAPGMIRLSANAELSEAILNFCTWQPNSTYTYYWTRAPD